MEMKTRILREVDLRSFHAKYVLIIRTVPSNERVAEIVVRSSCAKVDDSSTNPLGIAVVRLPKSRAKSVVRARGSFIPYFSGFEPKSYKCPSECGC